MKVGIVGCGFVGSAAAFALVMRGVGREVILVDRNAEKASAEADDIFHAVPFASALKIRNGEYSDLHGCSVVVVAAGVNQQPGETRLQLLERNAAVFAEVIPQIVSHAPETVLVVATNPVDVMTHLAMHFAGRRGVESPRVIGSGTTLDTARFRALLGEHFDVDPSHVHAYVIGEHGDSEVLTWSQATIAGSHLSEFSRIAEITLDEAKMAEIDDGVRRAAYHIIQGKGATYYGIGSALARIIEVILKDQRAVLTICSRMESVEGVRDVTLALPQIVGGTGARKTVPLDLQADERAALKQSATIIRDAISSLSLDL